MLLVVDRCHTNQYGIRPIISILPAMFRFIQCLKRYLKTRQFFPHIVNSLKYSTTFLVVMFSSLTAWYKGKGARLLVSAVHSAAVKLCRIQRSCNFLLLFLTHAFDYGRWVVWRVVAAYTDWLLIVYGKSYPLTVKYLVGVRQRPMRPN